MNNEELKEWEIEVAHQQQSKKEQAFLFWLLIGIPIALILLLNR